MTSPTQRVSMADVAARAGVSGQTVSRVVNGSPRVDPATRARIEHAMAELHYRPHRAARALRTGRTQTIGLVAATLATVGNSRMVQAVADAAAARGYSLVVVTLGAVSATAATEDDVDAIGAGGAGRGGAGAAPATARAAAGAGETGIAAAFERLRDQGVDGAIVLNEATALVRGASVPADLRLVVVDAPEAAAARGVADGRGPAATRAPAGARVPADDPGPADERGLADARVPAEARIPAANGVPADDPGPADDRGFDVVQTDHAAGARGATEHLLALGHPTVHHLAGPRGSYSADERERGWRAALAAAGVAAPEPVRGDWTAASGHRLGALLAAGTAVTAVFAANDQMALGLLRALAEAGRAVPGDVSVVGFDDVADAADYRPPLTTVRQDFDALGARALDVLVSGIEGAGGARDAAPSRVFERRAAPLVVRASTAAPRRLRA